MSVPDEEAAARLPSELSKAEIQECIEVIREGEAVDVASAKRELPRAVAIVTKHSDKEIVGVGAFELTTTVAFEMNNLSRQYVGFNARTASSYSVSDISSMLCLRNCCGASLAARIDPLKQSQPLPRGACTAWVTAGCNGLAETSPRYSTLNPQIKPKFRSILISFLASGH